MSRNMFWAWASASEQRRPGNTKDVRQGLDGYATLEAHARSRLALRLYTSDPEAGRLGHGAAVQLGEIHFGARTPRYLRCYKYTVGTLPEMARRRWCCSMPGTPHGR